MVRDSRRHRLVIATVLALLVGAAGCSKNVPQDSKTGEDGRPKGAKEMKLENNEAQSAFQQLGVGLAVFTAGAATVGAAFSLANAAGRFEQAVASAGAIAGATVAITAAVRMAPPG